MEFRRPAATAALVFVALQATVAADPGIYKLQIDDDSGTNWGSCFAVAENAGRVYFATAAHNLPNARLSITVDGRAVPLRVEAHDPSRDVGILSAACTVPKMLKLATDPPAPGEPVTYGGYPKGGAYVSRPGKILPTTYKTAENAPADLIGWSGASTPGMSGGPVWTRQGVVGVVSFTGGPAGSRCGPQGCYSIGCRIGPIRRLLCGLPGVCRPRPRPVVPIRPRPPIQPCPPPPDLGAILKRLDEIEARLAQPITLHLMSGSGVEAIQTTTLGGPPLEIPPQALDVVDLDQGEVWRQRPALGQPATIEVRDVQVSGNAAG